MTTTIKLSRKSRRTFNKRIRKFTGLLKQNEQIFLREWKKLTNEWVKEIHRRRKNWQNGDEYRNAKDHDGVIEHGRTHIFGIVELAEMYLEACGEEVEKLVGATTRQLLTDECSKAVSMVVDGRLAGNQTHHWYRWI